MNYRDALIMARGLLNLKSASELLFMSEGDLRTMAVQGEIDCILKGDAYFFEQEKLDLWKTRQIIGKGKDSKSKCSSPEPLPIPDGCVCASLPGNSRAGIIKELTNLAEKSGFLYDPEDFRKEIERREEAGSTNMGGGIAIPHLLTREEGYFSEAFVCIAKLARPSFFNSAPDGLPTELLILSCCNDSSKHIDMLKRISGICSSKNFMEKVRNAETDEELLQVIRNAEKE